jgi:two-component system, NarL family, sensor histidine kinase UhpB
VSRSSAAPFGAHPRASWGTEVERRGASMPRVKATRDVLFDRDASGFSQNFPRSAHRPVRRGGSSVMKLRTVQSPAAKQSPAAVSILWRVFTVNTLVFGSAVAILVVSPATVHFPVRFTELAVLIVGLAMTLAVDLVLLALVMSPVRKLASLMADIDPMRPGQRATVVGWASREALTLAGAFNTMLDRIETERRESARRALAAQEAERLRIARELHDEVGQTLTAVALMAEREIGEQSLPRPATHEIVQTIHHSLEDVRRIARELRPEALDDLGLVDALISLCLRMEHQGKIKVLRELEGSLPPLLHQEVELTIYRIAQEALTNAFRHAEASQVRVTLRYERDIVVLSVTDDGRGLLGPASAQSSGLAGMRERAILIGAELEIDSLPGAGVEVCLTVAAEPSRLTGSR